MSTTITYLLEGVAYLMIGVSLVGFTVSASRGVVDKVWSCEWDDDE